MVITVGIQNTVFCVHFVVRFALDNFFVHILAITTIITLRRREGACNSKQA